MQRNAKNGRPNRLPDAIKFNNMVAKNVKKSVKEIFETHMTTLKKHNCKDTDGDNDLENKNYRMEDVSASKTFALSDLRKPR